MKNILTLSISIIFGILIFELMGNLIYGKPMQTICFNKYDYFFCGNKNYINKLSDADGGDIIVDKSNNEGFIIDTAFDYMEKSSINDYQIYLIGDSFIQADEMSIEKRMAHNLRFMGIKSIEIGYSSWNTKQYLKVINSVSNKKNKYFFVFLMANDVTPDYGRSSYQNKLPNNFQKYIYRNLWSYYLIVKTRSVYLSEKKQKLSFLNDCKYNLQNNYDFDGSLINDYLIYSLKVDCWPKINLDAANVVLSDLKEMKKNIEDGGGKFKIFYIPPGFSFRDENSIGRLAIEYGVPSSHQIRTNGLSEYLRGNLPNNFIDLTPFLDSLKKDNQIKNAMYFSEDGHWTPLVHKNLSRLVYDIYIKRDVK
jgi:hypothetical protein